MRKGYKKYPTDFVEEVSEMLADGLTCKNVAWYLGVPSHVIKYLKDPARQKLQTNKWRGLNKERDTIYRKQYAKEYKQRTQERIEKLREELINSGKLTSSTLAEYTKMVGKG